jgi:putative addiction module killer protein
MAPPAHGSSRSRDDRHDWIGWLGHAGDAEPIGEGISELRIHYGPGYRVHFQKRANTIVVLLCGGDKSTQAKDIKTAKQLAKAWSE